MKALLAAGVPASKLVVGIPFYGRGWTGVTPGPQNNGLYQKATQPVPGKYEQGIQDYKILKTSPGTTYEHPVTKQSYKFVSGAKTWWSFDTPTAVKLKIDYVKAHSLRGAFSWELDGDGPNAELLKVMSDELK